MSCRNDNSQYVCQTENKTNNTHKDTQQSPREVRYGVLGSSKLLITIAYWPHGYCVWQKCACLTSSRRNERVKPASASNFAPLLRFHTCLHLPLLSSQRQWRKRLDALPETKKFNRMEPRLHFATGPLHTSNPSNLFLETLIIVCTVLKDINRQKDCVYIIYSGRLTRRI